MLKRTVLIYGVSTIAFTVYFAVARTRGPVIMRPLPAGGFLLLLIFVFALYYALLPTSLYLVGEFVVKRTWKRTS